MIKSTVTGQGRGGASEDFTAVVTAAMGCWTDAASSKAAPAVSELTSSIPTPLTTSISSATSTGMGGGFVAVTATVTESGSGSGSGSGSELQHTGTAPAASTNSSVTPVVRYSDIMTMVWGLVALMDVMELGIC